MFFQPNTNDITIRNLDLLDFSKKKKVEKQVSFSRILWKAGLILLADSLSNKQKKISLKKEIWRHPHYFLGENGGTSSGLGERFEGDFVDTCAKKNSPGVDV